MRQPEDARTCRHGRSVPTVSGERLCQLQEVVGVVQQAPLLCHHRDPAQEHLSKSSCLFDLPEDGLHRLFAQPVSTAMTTPSDLHLHGACASPDFRVTASAGRGVPVLLPTRGDVAADMPPIQDKEMVSGI